MSTQSTKITAIDFRGFISDEAFKTIKELKDIKNIVLSIQSGDASAFNELDMSYRKHLLAVASRKMDDKNYAKDIVQDVLREALLDIIEDNIPEINSDDFEQQLIGKMFKSLSYKTMEIGSDDRRFKDNFENKTTSIESSVEDEEGSSAIESIADDSLDYLGRVTEAEELSGLQRAVELLKGNSRKALELSFYRRMNVREISDELRVSKSTAANLINRGVENLKTILQND